MRDGVRYQFYKTADGHILFMASEREFWENFCVGIDRNDLFERWPGEKIADHALGNEELRADPSLANSDPLNKGWFFKVKLDDASILADYMDEDEYKDMVS